MADTGAPWNIPYVAGTDLVRDWPTDSQELAEAIADGLDIAGPAGIGSNVVQTVKTDVFTTTSTTFTSITGLAVTVTPSSATSKILVLVDLMYGNSGTEFDTAMWRVSGGNIGNYVGDAASNRTRGLGSSGRQRPSYNNNEKAFRESATYLDSPATTSPVTYQVEITTNAGSRTAYVNRANSDSDNNDSIRGASSITAIEVAA